MLVFCLSLSFLGRFRQVEVFQQATTAFLRVPQRKDLPPEALERRRHISLLFRRITKKALSQIHNEKTQTITSDTAKSPPCASPELLQPKAFLGYKKDVEPKHKEMTNCNCIAKEERCIPQSQAGHQLTTIKSLEGVLPEPAPSVEEQRTSIQNKMIHGKATALFKMDEAS